MKKLTILVASLFLMLGAAFAQVTIDGSSTVYPITLSIAEEFNIENPDYSVSVAFSGTGGGFEKFCAGETQISDASRPIKDSEAEACAAAGIEFVEVPVAYDALTVVVNPENDWATCMTVDELNMIWQPESGVTMWSDVRSNWPAEEIILYAPGVDSGTFDYFTEAINGEGGVSRSDFFPSEDDTVLVQGVEGDTSAMGYFGFAYYLEEGQKLKALEIDNGDGCVAPSAEAVEDGTYAPLSRPLFIYVSKNAMADNEAVAAFVDFYLDEANRELIADTGYVVLEDAMYEEAMMELGQ